MAWSLTPSADRLTCGKQRAESTSSNLPATPAATRTRRIHRGGRADHHERHAFLGRGEFAAAPSGGVVHVLDAGTRRVKRTFRVPAVVTAVAMSSDGRTAYLGGPDGTIYACDVTTGGVRYRLAGHHDRVTALAIAAKGSRLVSTSYDACALLWDLQPDLNASLDWSVLETVLKHLVTEPNSVFEGQHDANPTIFFSTEKSGAHVSVDGLLDRERYEKEWDKLSGPQLELAREAAKNLVRRQDDRDDFARYRPIDKRIVVWDAQRSRSGGQGARLSIEASGLPRQHAGLLSGQAGCDDSCVLPLEQAQRIQDLRPGQKRWRMGRARADFRDFSLSSQPT